MAEIRIEIGGLHDIIEELKDTKVRCLATECVNNMAWEGRYCMFLNEKCTLPSVVIEKGGKCDGYQTRDRRRGSPKGETELLCRDCDRVEPARKLIRKTSTWCPKCKVRYLDEAVKE